MMRPFLGGAATATAWLAVSVLAACSAGDAADGRGNAMGAMDEPASSVPAPGTTEPVAVKSAPLALVPVPWAPPEGGVGAVQAFADDDGRTAVVSGGAVTIVALGAVVSKTTPTAGAAPFEDVLFLPMVRGEGRAPVVRDRAGKLFTISPSGVVEDASRRMGLDGYAMKRMDRVDADVAVFDAREGFAVVAGARVTDVTMTGVVRVDHRMGRTLVVRDVAGVREVVTFDDLRSKVGTTFALPSIQDAALDAEGRVLVATATGLFHESFARPTGSPGTRPSRASGDAPSGDLHEVAGDDGKSLSGIVRVATRGRSTWLLAGSEIGIFDRGAVRTTHGLGIAKDTSLVVAGEDDVYTVSASGSEVMGFGRKPAGRARVLRALDPSALRTGVFELPRPGRVLGHRPRVRRPLGRAPRDALPPRRRRQDDAASRRRTHRRRTRARREMGDGQARVSGILPA
ncbi:MAG: hypothetical protein U0169_15200 [Polyangiaceae bacterium]